jgi:hypothetical protein
MRFVLQTGTMIEISGTKPQVKLHLSAKHLAQFVDEAAIDVVRTFVGTTFQYPERINIAHITVEGEPEASGNNWPGEMEGGCKNCGSQNVVERDDSDLSVGYYSKILWCRDCNRRAD